MKQWNIKTSWNRVNPGEDDKRRMLEGILRGAAVPARKSRFSLLRIPLAACLAAALLSLLFLSWKLPRSRPAVDSKSDSPASEVRSEPEESMENGVSTQAYQDTAACYAAISLPELAEESSLIVRGTVTGRSEDFHISGRYGTEGPYADYYVEPSEVLRGDLENASEVSVRWKLPRVLPENAEYSTLPETELQTGQEYVFFLTRHSVGCGIYTRGGHYDPVSPSQGIFEKNGDGYSSQLETFSLDTLREEAAAFRDIPFDPEKERQDYLERYQTNLEQDVFTQEACEEDMAFLDVFATVLEAAVGSVDGDPRLALPRSYRVNARYVEAIPEDAPRSDAVPELARWTKEERAEYLDQQVLTKILGTVERLRQIELWTDDPSSRVTYFTVAEVRIERFISGDARLWGSDTAQKTVQILLPQTLYGDIFGGGGPGDPDPLYRLEKGVRAIFLMTGISREDCISFGEAAEDGVPQLYYRDLAEYRLDEYARGLVVEADGGVDFLSSDYPDRFRTKTIEEFADYLTEDTGP